MWKLVLKYVQYVHHKLLLGFFFLPVIHLKHIWSNKTCSHVTLTALLLLGGAAEQTY